MKVECDLSPCKRAFVKLSTRSPKDSKIILQNAKQALYQRLEEIKSEGNNMIVDDNMKWIILSEEVIKIY